MSNAKKKKSGGASVKATHPSEIEARESAENEGMPSRVSLAGAPLPRADALEGEGSRTAARRYEEGLKRSIEQGASKALGDSAAKALDGPEAAELRRAEQAARAGRSAQGAARH